MMEVDSSVDPETSETTRKLLETHSTCPICLTLWTSTGEHRVVALPCGHLYGKSCIEEWIERKAEAGCPECHGQVTKEQLHIVIPRLVFAAKEGPKPFKELAVDLLEHPIYSDASELVYNKMASATVSERVVDFIIGSVSRELQYSRPPTSRRLDEMREALRCAQDETTQVMIGLREAAGVLGSTEDAFKLVIAHITQAWHSLQERIRDTKAVESRLVNVQNIVEDRIAELERGVATVEE